VYLCLFLELGKDRINNKNQHEWLDNVRRTKGNTDKGNEFSAEDGGIVFLRNAVICPKVEKALQPRRQLRYFIDY
jgi:hypothetical protein